MPSDGLVQLVLGNRPGRQAVVPMVVMMPPEKLSVRRHRYRIVPYSTPAAAGKLHYGVVGARRCCGGEAERQYANCESKSLHFVPPH